MGFNDGWKESTSGKFSGMEPMSALGLFLGALLAVYLCYVVLKFVTAQLDLGGNWYSVPMKNRKRRFQNAPSYGTSNTSMGVANSINTQAGLQNAGNRPLLMQPYQLKSYMNKLYPPPGTSVNPQGCIVSETNDCPKDLYWKCNSEAWSKDAIGEALALSSVGSYYLPSGVEEENLNKVIALAHEPVTAACRNAGNVSPGGYRDPNLLTGPLQNSPSAP